MANLVGNIIAIATGITAGTLVHLLGRLQTDPTVEGADPACFFMAWASLFALVDFAMRWRSSHRLNGAARVLTRRREPPSAVRPVNTFLSGEYGAQFFWVIPGWLAGTVVFFVVLLDWVTRAT